VNLKSFGWYGAFSSNNFFIATSVFNKINDQSRQKQYQAIR
jgi:hypothetical protein